MVRKKNSNDRGETSSPRKLGNVRLKESAVYSAETNRSDSYAKIQDYIKRRQNNEYMTADELKGYRQAYTTFQNENRRLNDYTRARGGTVDVNADKATYDWLNSIGADLNSAEQVMSGFKNADEYKTALAEYEAEAPYRQKYEGMSYAELKKALEDLNTKTKIEGFDPKRNGNISSPLGPSLADVAERKWLEQYAESVKNADDYQDDIYNIDKQIAQVESDISAYDSWRMQTGEAVQSNYREFANKYGTKAKAEQMLELLKKQKANAEAKIKYGYVEQEDDFEKYSAEGASIINPTMSEAEGKLSIGKNRIGGKEVGNIVTYSRDNAEVLAMGEANGSSLVGKSIYNLMEDDEVNTYNYLLAKYGEAEAQSYLDSLEEELNYRQGAGIGQRLRSVENPIAKAAATGVVGITAGLDQWATGIRQLGNEEALPTTAIQYASGDIRENMKSNVGKAAYDVVTTTANMAPSILASYLLGGMGVSNTASQIVGGVTLGASAAGNAYAEAKRMGYTTEQARNYGVLVGASETALQYVLGGISSLGGSVTNNIIAKSVQNIDNALLKAAAEIGINMAGEGAEEYLQEILDPVYRNLMLGEDNEIKLVTEEAAYSFLLGALSAGLLEGGGNVVGKAAQNSYYKSTYGENVADLVNEALEIDPEYEYGEKMKSRIDDGKKLNGGQIGKLVEHNNDLIRAADTTAIADRLYELGETGYNGNVDEIAGAIAKMEAGEELTNAESRLISKSMYGEYVAKERAEGVPNTVPAPASAPADTDNAEPVINVQNENAPTVSPENNLAINTEAVTPELQSIATENKKFAVKGVVVATATDKQGNEIGVIGYNDNGDLITTKGVKDIEALEFDDPAYADIVEDAKAYKGAEDLYIRAFSYLSGNINPAIYNQAFNNFFTAGSLLNMGIEFDSRWAKDKNAYSDVISEDYARLIFDTARKIAIEKRNAQSREQDVQRRKNASKNKKKGRVHLDIDESTLTERQKVSVEVVKRIAKAIKAEVYFYASYLDENNVRVYKNAEGNIEKAPNGFYDPKDGSIHLDINAGDTGKSLILFTAAHELTHLIKDQSAVKFDALADFLMEQYHKKGVDIAELIDEQIEKARENGRTIDYDTAYEEVVASSMETMLSDGKLVEKLSELSKKDKGIVQKITDYFKELADKIRAVYKNLAPESREGQLVAEMVKATEQLQELFFDALKDVAETGVVVDKSSADSDVKFDSRNFSYSELVAKEDLRGVWIFPNEQPKIVNNIVDTNWVINEVRKNCETLSTNGGTVYYVNVPDIGRNVEIVGKGIRHSFDRPNDKRGGKSSPKALVNARVALKVPQILKNSIEVNRSKRGNNIDVPYTRVLVGSVALENNDGTIDYYAVRSMVEERTNQKSVLVEMNILGLLTSTNAKKIDSPTVRVDKNIVALADGGAFTYRIADLLDDVKGVLDNTFSDNVYDHFGIKRTNDDFSQYLLFSDRASSRSMLVSALEPFVQTEEERAQLEKYKNDIEAMEAKERRLTELREEINNMQFTRGKRDTEFLDKLSDLREEARKITSELTRYDESILKLESTQALKTLISRERASATKFEKAKAEKAKQRAARRREIAETRRKTLNIAYSIESLLSRETKNRNIKEGMKDVGGKLLSLSKFLFEDVVDNADIARLGIEGLDEDEKLFVTRYVELADRRDALKEEERKIRNDDSVSREVREQRLKEFRDKYRAEREAMTKEISRFNNVELKAVFDRERRILNRRSPEKVIGALETAYRGLQNSDSDYIKDVYSDLVLEKITSLKNELEGVIAGEMTLSQTQSVYEVFKMVKHAISQADKLFADNKSGSLSNTVANVHKEIDVYKHDDKRIGDMISDKFSTLNRFSWNNLKPGYAFRRVGSKTLEKLFMNLAMADGTWAKDIDEAKTFIEETREKYGYKKWNIRQTKTFTMADGRELVLTLGNMQAIYAYSKREQALDHMRIGGFKFVKGAKFGTLTQKGANGKYKGVKKRTDRGDTYRMTTELINDIVASLTPEQKQYVDALQEYMSNELASKGNSVSMKLFGIELFKEKNYMPIQSVRAFLNSVKVDVGAVETMVSLKNTGMTKPTKPHAENPIVLKEFEDFVFEHIDTMAKYHAYVLPIEDMQRVFNAGTYTADNKPISTKSEIEAVYGGEARAYFENYIKDLNGGNRGGALDSLPMMLFSRMKKNAVSASLSVAIQQPFAITRAMAMIDPKYFIGAKGKTNNDLSLYKEMRKYAPITIVKEIGGYDMGSSRSATEFMGRTKYGLEKAGSAIDKVSMALPELMDRLGWSAIWIAVKNEVADTNKDLKVGSQEFFEKCNERFTEVITYTQVYDSVNSRSGLMRSKSELDKFATSFAGEPTTYINMLFDAWNNLYRSKYHGDRAGAWKKVGRTVVVLGVTSLLTKAAVSLVYAMRDDDEDEAYWEKYMQALGEQLKAEINPLNSIPYARDIISIIKGWDVERPDLTVISDMVTSGKRLWKAISDKDTSLDTVMKFADALGNVCNVPIKNVRRDAMALWRAGVHIFDDKKSDNLLEEFWNGVSEGTFFESTNDAKIKKVAKFVDQENYEGATSYVSDWVNDKALELSEKDGVSAEDFEKFAFNKNKYTEEAKKSLKRLFTNEYKEKYLDAVKKKDVKTVKQIRVILFNTELYKEKKKGIEVNDIDAIFDQWRKEDFEKEYKEAYKTAIGIGDTKTAAQIEAKVKASGFYKKPADTLKNWRKSAEEIRDQK